MDGHSHPLQAEMCILPIYNSVIKPMSDVLPGDAAAMAASCASDRYFAAVASVSWYGTVSEVGMECWYKDSMLWSPGRYMVSNTGLKRRGILVGHGRK